MSILSGFKKVIRYIKTSTGYAKLSQWTSSQTVEMDDGTTLEDKISSINTTIGNKVDKVSGKGLSTNDYTTTEKNKLAGIASGAEVNVQSDWNVTDTNSDAYIKNKPSSMPANGGTSSTISTTLPISKGGTGKTTGADAANVLLNSLMEGTDTPVDADYYICQYVNGGTSNTSYTRRPISKLYKYIRNKLSTVATTGSYTDLSNKPGIGNASVSGLTKLYTGTGQNTDGAMTQKAINDALGGKANSSHSHNNASTSSSGFMSAADKAKLDGIAEGATSGSYTHPTYTSKSSGLYKITVDSTGHVSNTSAVTKSDITALGIPGTDTNTVYTHPTTDGNKHVPANGTTNGGKYLKATSTSGSYEWGDLTKNDVINALGYTPGTSSADPITVDGTLSSTSTNAIQNKAVYSALSGKSDTNHTHSTGNVTTAGFTKLYSSTGTATDGTMTQAAITSSVNGSAFSATCATSASTASKVVTVSGVTSLVTGMMITIKFSNGDTSSTAKTLNVNALGTKSIYYRNAAIPMGYIKAGGIYSFRYNGTQWDLVGDIDTDTTTIRDVYTTGETTINANYPIYFSPSSDITSTSSRTVPTVTRHNSLYFNPNTKTLSVYQIKENGSTLSSQYDRRVNLLTGIQTSAATYNIPSSFVIKGQSKSVYDCDEIVFDTRNYIVRITGSIFDLLLGSVAFAEIMCVQQRYTCTVDNHGTIYGNKVYIYRDGTNTNKYIQLTVNDAGSMYVSFSTGVILQSIDVLI